MYVCPRGGGVPITLQPSTWPKQKKTDNIHGYHLVNN